MYNCIWGILIGTFENHKLIAYLVWGSYEIGNIKWRLVCQSFGEKNSPIMRGIRYAKLVRLCFVRKQVHENHGEGNAPKNDNYGVYGLRYAAK